MKKNLFLYILIITGFTAFGQSVNEEFFEAMKDGRASVEQLEGYLDRGANVNYISQNVKQWYLGFTPIQVAAVNQRLDWFKLFESKGADIYALTQTDETVAGGNMFNNPNYNALQLAAYYFYEGNTDLLDYLISKNYDINAYCDNGYTILQACLISEYTKIDIIKYLVEHGADVNQTHKQGNTGPLFWTFANQRRYDVAEYLVSKGAKTKMTEWYWNNNLLAYTLYDNYSKFSKLFIENGLFDIFQPKEIGTYENYPVHSYFEAAIYYRDYTMVKYMINKGVMPDINNDTGKAALKIANDNKDEVMVKLLTNGKVSSGIQNWLDLTADEEYKSVDFRNGDTQADYSTTDMNGRTINASDFRGKIVLMNYWATWCPYCIQEMPSMQSLLERIGKDKMVILAITTEDNDRLEEINSFINKKDYDFIWIHDPDNTIAKSYSVGTLPGTRLFDTKGYTMATVDGSRAWDKDMYLKLIKTMYNKDNASNSYANTSNTNTTNTTTTNTTNTNTTTTNTSTANYSNWLGHWETNWGSSTIVNINFTESNGELIGTYDFKNGHIEAKIVKEPGATFLDGKWTQANDAGWLKFTLSRDGKSFKGQWGYTYSGSAEGVWNGTKK